MSRTRLPVPLSAFQQLRPLLSPQSRATGRRYCGARGSGKSALLAWLSMIDLASGIATIAIDPAGALTFWLLGTLEHESASVKQQLLPRVRYFRMRGVTVGQEAYLPTWPLLYRRDLEEPLEEIARRPLETWIRADPQLSKAPIQGSRALIEQGSYALMLLYAMGCQVSELSSLLSEPQRWRERILAARAQYPDELAVPAHFFLDVYPNMRERERELKVGALRARLPMFDLNPLLRAQFAADLPSLDLAEIERKRLFVIIDFQGIASDEQKEFSVLWVYKHFMDAFRARRPGKGQLPISFVIDEASFVLPGKDSPNPLLADDFTQFVQQIARQNNVWLSVVHQELRQFDDAVTALLGQFGGQILGATADLEGAVQVAQRFAYYNPYRVKRWRNVWASDPLTREHFVIDQEPVYFTEREQALTNAKALLELAPFTFQIGVAAREGALPTALTPVDLRAYATGRFPDPERVEQVRTALAIRFGQPASELLAQIARRGQTTGRAVHETTPDSSTLPHSSAGRMQLVEEVLLDDEGWRRG